MGKVVKLTDRFNTNKAWLIKRTKCGHYFYNQVNGNRKLNKGYTKTTKAFLKDLLGYDPLKYFQKEVTNNWNYEHGVI